MGLPLSKMAASLGWLMMLSRQLYRELQMVDLRLEVSDNVGDLLPQLGVNVTGECVGEGGSDEDIGEGDPLSDNVGSVKEDLV